MRRSSFFIVAMILLAGWQLAQAQCGASLSSCKTCHEVKREKPVATQGQWHQQHAFGDFCEFCHGGNTAAKDKNAAHEGINPIPIKDAGNTCSSCHPDDYAERAQKYAAILKIDLGDLESKNEAPAKSTDSAAETTEPRATTSAGETISIPTGGEVVDFNSLLAEEKHVPRAYGNLIMVVLIIGLFGVFLLLYWSFNKEKLTQRIKDIAGQPSPEEEKRRERTTEECQRALEKHPELKELTAQLMEMDHSTIEGLMRIARHEEIGEQVILAISHIDLELVSKIKSLKSNELDAVLALATKI